MARHISQEMALRLCGRTIASVAMRSETEATMSDVRGLEVDGSSFGSADMAMVKESRACVAVNAVEVTGFSIPVPPTRFLRLLNWKRSDDAPKHFPK
jgi:hypothetical protein